MSPPLLVARYPTPAEFLTAYTTEVRAGGLLVRGATLEKAVAQAECSVEVHVAQERVAALPARVAAVVPGVGVAVTFASAPEPLSAYAQRLQAGEAPAEEAPAPEEHDPEQDKPEHRTVSERIHALSVAQKMQLALSGDRTERFVLIRDTNKVIHVYVLRNPRLGLDEAQAASKLHSLSADAIKYISEHTQWSANPLICANLVRNPATPLPLALKLIDRVPMHDLKAIAKGGARQQLVHAARKKLNA
jgi:hypothetical protein